MIGNVNCVMVSHTHWDREWYRTFQAFRARLVDTVDSVLDLLDQDPGWSFVLDGQTIVVEDYLAIRPEQVDRIRDACRSGRLTIGPWYVQPDSLLPGGETHVRNLLEGRRVGEQFGPVSRVAYTPDSFGHPAQFPQLFAGFGLDGFVYWRGNGDEIETLPPVYRWVAPDGTSMVACHLTTGYFNAATLQADVPTAVKRLQSVGEEMLRAGSTSLLFMNGVDHSAPRRTHWSCRRCSVRSDGLEGDRGRLEDFTESVIASGIAKDEFAGELVGARISNLLPGVWSSRVGLKLRNRRAETALVGWAEPWAALGCTLGLPDERPALRIAWRALLANQAHDSIGGCSQDRVHEQMMARYDEAEELADETTARVLSRLAGLGVDRAVPWSDELDVAVFNPSPHSRSDVVRFDLDGHPLIGFGEDGQGVHPLVLTSVFRGGVTVDGEPARVLLDDTPERVRVIPEQHPWTVEWVAEDIPAFGWRRYRIARGRYTPDEVDDGREIGWPGLTVAANDDGTLTIATPHGRYNGLGAIEDQGDRGDSYDFDPVSGPIHLASLDVSRRRHGSGIEELHVERIFEVPTSLDPGRKERSSETVPIRVSLRARVARGIGRVDLQVTVDNTARDHRLRLGFPTGGPGEAATAATTFDVIGRPPRSASPSTWIQSVPPTFPQQGWVHSNGLTVGAPGLPEAEVTADGVIYITLLRAVGWLSRLDLASRPEPAGPGLEAPGAQCLGETTAHLSLSFGSTPQVAAWDAELGLRAVPAGPDPLLDPGQSVLTLDAPDVVLSALKPAEHGPGLVVRVLNPTDENRDATLRWNLPTTVVGEVRLDEEHSGSGERSVERSNENELRCSVPAHGLRSWRLETPG